MKYFVGIGDGLDDAIERYRAAKERCERAKRAARRASGDSLPVTLGLLALFSGVTPLSTEAGGATSPFAIPFRSAD